MSLSSKTKLVALANLFVLILIGPALANAQELTAIRIQPRAGVTLPPFSLDLVVEDDGQMQGTLGAAGLPHGLTLKRGLVEELPDGEIATTYEVEHSQESSAGPILLSAITMRLSGNSSLAVETEEAGFEVAGAFLAEETLRENQDGRPLESESLPGNPEDGCEIIIWDVVGAAGSGRAPLGLSFAPSAASERLRGEPTYLFNSPAAGEDLVLLLPAVAPGSLYSEDVTVYRGQDAEAQVRITIKHEI